MCTGPFPSADARVRSTRLSCSPSRSPGPGLVPHRPLQTVGRHMWQKGGLGGGARCLSRPATNGSGGHFPVGGVGRGRLVPRGPPGAGPWALHCSPLHTASESGSLLQKSGVRAPGAQERHRRERSRDAAPGGAVWTSLVSFRGGCTAWGRGAYAGLQLQGVVSAQRQRQHLRICTNAHF